MMITKRATLQPHSALESHAPACRARRRRARVSETLLMGVVAALLLAMALIYVGQRTYLMTLTYRVEALDRSVADALREREFLQLKMAQAHSLAHVEQVATGRLGMVRPESMQYVVMESTAQVADASSTPVEHQGGQRGLIAMAVDWVAQHWPRVETAEAGGERQ